MRGTLFISLRWEPKVVTDNFTYFILDCVILSQRIKIRNKFCWTWIHISDKLVDVSFIRRNLPLEKKDHAMDLKPDIWIQGAGSVPKCSVSGNQCSASTRFWVLRKIVNLILYNSDESAYAQGPMDQLKQDVGLPDGPAYAQGPMDQLVQDVGLKKADRHKASPQPADSIIKSRHDRKKIRPFRQKTKENIGSFSVP